MSGRLQLGSLRISIGRYASSKQSKPVPQLSVNRKIKMYHPDKRASDLVYALETTTVPFDIDGPAMMQHRVSRTAALDVWGSGATRTGRRAKKNSKIRLGTSLIIDLVEYWGSRYLS